MDRGGVWLPQDVRSSLYKGDLRRFLGLLTVILLAKK